MNADLLILLTDVGGVFDKHPSEPGAKVSSVSAAYLFPACPGFCLLSSTYQLVNGSIRPSGSKAVSARVRRVVVDASVRVSYSRAVRLAGSSSHSLAIPIPA